MLLPEQKITLTEVAPRDGFQGVEPWIKTEDKISVVKALFKSGVDFMEVSSLVSPKAIPQLRDALEVIQSLTPVEKAKSFVLIPNLRGAEIAAQVGIQNITYVISASQQHNLHNVKKMPEASFKELKTVALNFPELTIKLDVATAFGCPFAGDVDEESVKSLVDATMSIGIQNIVLCDTVGVANPIGIANLVKALRVNNSNDDLSLGLHLHNTRGLAAANILMGLYLGITHFESAAGGVGGCPYAPGATGNLATEDLVFMLHEMGHETNVDVNQVINVTATFLERLDLFLDRKINSTTISKTFKP